MNDKVLVTIACCEAPVFLDHLIRTISTHDAGYAYDLLIVDNDSKGANQLKLLEKLSKTYRVEVRPNYGRAQGGYDYAWQNNKDYKYYFFMHEDSSILKHGWLKKAVDRIEDQSLEDCLASTGIADYPVGKVGFQTYEWGNKKSYLRTGHRQVFHYMEPLAEIMGMKMPSFCQHINDDRYLIKNELLQKMTKIWNVEDFKQLELQNDERWHKIDKFYADSGLHANNSFLPERYGSKYNAFQTMSEFLSDIGPMCNGYRTHCVVGDGHSQEELGWSRFWGNDYIAHFGDHSLFKRLSILLKEDEDIIRKRFTHDKAFLNIVDKIIKNDSK